LTNAGANKRLRSIAAAASSPLRALAFGVLAMGVFALGALTLGAIGNAPAVAAAANVGGATAPSAGTTKASTHASKTKSAKKTPSPHVLAVRITDVECVPASKCSSNPRQVSTHGTLTIAGKGLGVGMTVGFPHARDARVTRSSPIAHLRKGSAGLEVTVPKSAHSGNIMVLLSHGRYTSSYGPISIVRYALHPPPPKDPPAPAPVAGTPSGTAFEGQGMWIWYLSASDGGDLASIVAQAHAAGVTTLFIKSSDGSTNYWSQFSPQLVAELHANGLKVCAWQFVYGTEPVGEANLGAEAAADGADCLVIDAEGEYEGRYGAAQTYIDDLRAKIGPTYPLGLASFPYVYDHASFPYSVFLGPNGAQFNAPQMYWKDIGNSIDTAYANTYISNRVYGRPIFPLGQTYESPSSAELVRFREEAVDYGATGVSWWDWQETPASEWTALAEPLAPLTSVTPNPGYTELEQGNRGDPVLWMQEHLASAIPTQATTGIFDATTAANLAAFQSAHGIAPTGKTEAATWQALLALPPVAVNWTGGGPQG
jgi:peptidoglycan hydrolase-like protein with peptidoglycan-binding domain